MNTEDAKLVLRAGCDVSQLLHAAAAVLHKRLGTDESQALALNIGYVIGEIDQRLFKPVFESYPEYDPGTDPERWAKLSEIVGAGDWTDWPDTSVHRNNHNR